MASRRSAVLTALAGAALAGAAFAGAGPAAAAPPPPPAPVDPFAVPAPPPPVVTYPLAPVAGGAAMTPRQLAVPADPAAPPPVLSEGGIPEIQPTYGSGKYGGGIMGTLKDLWDQAKNPGFVPDMVGGPVAPGAAAVPSAPAEAGSAAPGPALPPGYYPLDGPPPPGYEYATPVPGLPST